MIEVGIVGGTGYTGAELLRLLAGHPGARVRTLTSRQEAGVSMDAFFPHLRDQPALRGLAFTAPDPAELARCDAVFFATPHGAAMQLAPALVDKGVKVIDLSADFRLSDPAAFKQWYGMDHAAPALLPHAVYGLPEFNREALKRATLVAAPGCYPTSVQLGLMPLLVEGAASTDDLIADCKSGVSGAGRELKQGSLFAEAAESFKAYGVPKHRHQPEIEQGLARIAGRPVTLTFVPHLVPMNRGIHATLYARLTREVDVQALYEKHYGAEPFVDVLPAGSHPDTRAVRGANTCRIAVHALPGRRVVVLAVIDNLVKGAAGQAVQCFNLMTGQDERAGLGHAGFWP